MRKCHWIRPNHKCESPSRAIFLSLDIVQSAQDEHGIDFKMQSGWAITAVKNTRKDTWYDIPYYLNNGDAFWLVLEDFVKQKTRTYIICNNSQSTLTLLNIFTTGPSLGWKLTQPVLNCPPCIVKLTRDRRTVTILDICNLWPTLYYDTWLGVNGIAEKNSDEDNASPPYVVKSSLAAKDMYERMTAWWKFLKDNDLGSFAPTAGSQSMRTWRHKYMTHKVLIDCHDDALQLARDGLFGGRVECFRIGRVEGPLTMLDISSAYPWVMANMRVPTKLLGYASHATLGEVKGWIDEYQVVAEVVVHTDMPQYPVRDGLHVVFPIGKFATVLCSKELRAAIHQQHVVAVRRAAVYQCDPAFSAYMQALWAERRRSVILACGEDAERWKLLMNAYFGKWAQKGGYWEDIERITDLSIKHWIDVDFKTKEKTDWRQVGGLVQKRNMEKESSESSPAIAACVTSDARYRLYEYISRAGRDNIAYVDTDSLLVSAVGLGRLHDCVKDAEFGGLRIQGQYAGATIYGAKHYELDGQKRFSGVPKSAVYSDARTMVSYQSAHIAAGVLGDDGSRVRRTVLWRSYQDARYKELVGEDGRVRPVEKNE